MSAKLTLKQHIQALALNLPSGRLWNAKLREGSNLYKLLSGLAPTFRQMDWSIQRFVEQSVPTTTEDYLAEWEEALGLPDECLPIAADVATRQRNISIKLSILAGVSTEQDFIDLAALFGLTVTVNSGIEHLIAADGGYETAVPTQSFGAGDYTNVQEARYTMVVVETTPASASFDYDWDIPFSLQSQDEMRCLFTKLKPANSAIQFVTAP